MHLNEYQGVALASTAYPIRADQGVEYMALGLAGEAGEVANVVKKDWRAAGLNAGLTSGTRAKLLDELGDVLWYLAALASAADLTLEEIAQEQLLKLERIKTRRLGVSG